MKRSVLAVVAACAWVAAPAWAEQQAAPHQDDATGEASRRMVERCVTSAAAAYRLPPVVLVILLHVEGGSLGRVSENTNGTVDIGPMQINQLWLPQLAAHWRAQVSATFRALRDEFCPNVEAGAWILRQGLDEAHGDFWGGVGYYHSHDPDLKTGYLRMVLDQMLRLRSAAAVSRARALRVAPAAASPLAPASEH